MQSTLTLPVSIRDFAAVDALIEPSARSVSLDREIVQRIVLAVDEVWRRLCELADRERLPEEEREAEVCVECDAESMTVFVCDELVRAGIDFESDTYALDFARRCVDRIEVVENILGGRCVSLQVGRTRQLSLVESS